MTEALMNIPVDKYKHPYPPTKESLGIHTAHDVSYLILQITHSTRIHYCDQISLGTATAMPMHELAYIGIWYCNPQSYVGVLAWYKYSARI